MISMRALVVGVAICSCACGGPAVSEDAAPPTDAGIDADATPRDAAPRDAAPRDADADVGSGTSVEAFQSAYGAAYCEMFVKCESFFSVGALRVPYQGYSCHPGAPRAWDETNAALAAGTIVYDATAAARCLEWFAASDCEGLFLELGDACGDVWVPTIPPGGSCATQKECIDGRCITDAECPGTCVAYGGVGAPCGGALLCQSGLRCTGDGCRERGGLGTGCAVDPECSPELVCQGGVCAARPGAGETCSPTTSTSPCAGSLVCAPSTSTCVVGGMEGDSCASTPCAISVRCDEATDTCVRAVLPGGTCTVDVECPATFFCGSGVCAPLPVPGEACVTAPFCARGACDSGACTLVLEGESCDTTSSLPLFGLCADGLYCGVGRICTPRLPDGAVCDASTPCLESHQCRGNVCHPRCSPADT
ncbi:MAG: hypothetical protein DRI65_13735 [Chloroflexota bacterium]|nr:MAG: hypothetical protein DRI65_13735 [Chloroflexota bacterium]